MSRKNKRKRRNRSAECRLKNRDQLNKLEQDAACFISVAENTKYLRDKADPNSLIRLGYATVMQTNFGIGFELKLKSLQFRTKGFYSFRSDHKLVPLFDSLDKKIRDALDFIFERVRPQMGIIQQGSFSGPIILDKDNPSISIPFTVSPVLRLKGFRALLEAFDEIASDQKGMYGRRYSFETYAAKQELWADISISTLPLIRMIDKFVETLPEPKFPE